MQTSKSYLCTHVHIMFELIKTTVQYTNILVELKQSIGILHILKVTGRYFRVLEVIVVE